MRGAFSLGFPCAGSYYTGKHNEYTPTSITHARGTKSVIRCYKSLLWKGRACERKESIVVVTTPRANKPHLTHISLRVVTP